MTDNLRITIIPVEDEKTAQKEIVKSELDVFLHHVPMSFYHARFLVESGIIDTDKVDHLESYVLGESLKELREEFRIVTQETTREFNGGFVPEIIFKSIRTEEDGMAAIQNKTERDHRDNIQRFQGRRQPDDSVRYGEKEGRYFLEPRLIEGTFQRRKRDPMPDRVTYIKPLPFEDTEKHRRFQGEVRSAPDYKWQIEVKTVKVNGLDAHDEWKMIGIPEREFHNTPRIHELKGEAYGEAILKDVILPLRLRTMAIADYALRLTQELAGSNYIDENGNVRNALYTEKGQVRKKVIDTICVEVIKFYDAEVPKDRKSSKKELPHVTYGQYSYPLAQFMLSQLNQKTKASLKDKKKMVEMIDYFKHVVLDAAEHLKHASRNPVQIYGT